MKPEGVTVHNTYNDASARNEVAYMTRNPYNVSYHWAVDDVEAIQAIPHNRNSWSCGDGTYGFGNRKTINVEICYSKSGGARFDQAEKNGAKLIATILNSYGWGLNKLYTHRDHSGKYCPHRTLDRGYSRFTNMVRAELAGLKGQKTTSKAPVQSTVKTHKKTNEQVAREVLQGLWGNGDDRKHRLQRQGYNYNTIQGLVNELVNGKSKNTAPKKSVNTIAKEVLNGKWGNGDYRKNKLEQAGYNYNEVQKAVNTLANSGSKATPTPQKTVNVVAKEVLDGKWGNGNDRKTRLTKAGYNYSEVQKAVNSLVNGGRKSNLKSINTIAHEVLQGKWGNGQDRKNRLTKAGYNYSEVQKAVNKLA